MKQFFLAVLLFSAATAHAVFPGPTTTVNDTYLWGVPTFLSDSTWLTIPGMGTYWPTGTYTTQFNNAGSHLYVFTITPSRSDCNRCSVTWTGPGNFVYQGFGTIDDLTAGIINYDPNAKIVYRIDIGSPDWWLTDPANAPELEKMYNGWTVCDSDFGVAPRRGPFPSLASTKWRTDMATCINNLMDHIENGTKVFYCQEYKNNIFGFIITGLATDEWYHWSSGTDKFWGYGDRTKTAFRAWLTTKYGTNAALQSAWTSATVTLANAEPPGYWDRKDEGLNTTFRSPSTKMRTIDFMQFWNDLIPETLDYFGGVVKAATDNTKVVGAFYGYSNEFAGDPEFGHNALYKYVNSPNLDFMFSCSSYGNRWLTGGTYTRAPHTSVELHHKLLMVENDTATSRTPTVLTSIGVTEPTYTSTLLNLGYKDPSGNFTLDTLWENQQMLRRDAGFAICNGIYYDYFDLHGGYYNDTALMNEVSNLNNNLHNRMPNYDRSSVAQILVVSDEFSCNYPLRNSQLLRQAMYEPLQQLIKIGAPYDHVLLDDLGGLTTTNYKLVIFLNCFNMTSTQRTNITNKLKSNNRILMFCYAPGFFNGNSMSTANMNSVTAMTHTVASSNTYVAPRITIQTGSSHALAQALVAKGFTTVGPTAASCKKMYVSATGVTTLGKYPSTSQVNFAIKNNTTWQSIYCVTASVPAGVLREIARYAGVHLFVDNDANDTVYANKMFVTVHAATAGNRTLQLPASYTIYDALAQSWLATGSSYTRNFAQGETMIFQYQ